MTHSNLRPKKSSIRAIREAIHHIACFLMTPKTSIAVWITLLIATGLTFTGAAFIDLHEFNPILALAIACFKGVIVILFFMHVYFQLAADEARPSPPASLPSSCSLR